MRIARSAIVVMGLLAAAPVLAQTAAPEKPSVAEEVSISFAQFGGIDDWRADGNKALFVKGRRNNEWYYAKLMSTCQGLNFAEAVGFKNEATGSFDKFSTIVVDGQPCQLTSLVKSAPPPKKK